MGGVHESGETALFFEGTRDAFSWRLEAARPFDAFD